MKRGFAPHWPIMVCLLLTLASIVEATELGVNVNVNMELLDFNLLARSRTTWTRSFVDIFPFHQGIRHVQNDPKLAHFKEVADAGYKMVLSLKHDFHGRNLDLPRPGSEEETAYFRSVMEVLDDLVPYTSILVIGNEPTWETTFANREFDSTWGNYPMVVFYKRLTDAILSHLEQHPELGTPPVYFGAFNRLELEKIRSMGAVQALLQYADSEERIAGIDIHLHGINIDGFNGQLEFARKYTDKPILATEFSLTYRYAKYTTEPLGVNEAGQEFAKAYGLDPEMQVYQYVRQAAANPVPQSQWAEFLQSRSWYEPHLIAKCYPIFQKFGVKLATYAFTSGFEKGPTFGPDANPWILNQLFLPKLAYAENGEPATNYGVYEDFIAINQVVPYAAVTVLDQQALIGLAQDSYAVTLPYGTTSVPEAKVSALPETADPQMSEKQLSFQLSQPHELPGKLSVKTFDETGSLVHTALIELRLVERPPIKIQLGEAVLTTDSTQTARVQGAPLLSVTTTAPASLFSQTKVTLTPVLGGEIQTAKASCVYDGANLPDRKPLNSLLWDDGAYDLQVELTAKNGDVFIENRRLLIENWEVLLDELEPPQDTGWFGTVKQRKTVSESSGWESVRGDEKAPLDDTSLLTATGITLQYLMWEIDAANRFLLTLYATEGTIVADALFLSCSTDMEQWITLPYALKETSVKQGWREIVISASLGEHVSARYFRLVVNTSELTYGNIQLGRVEIMSPKKAPDK